MIVPVNSERFLGGEKAGTGFFCPQTKIREVRPLAELMELVPGQGL